MQRCATASTATAPSSPSTASPRYGLALNKQHETDKLAMVMQNISQYVVEDNENQTAYLKLPEGIWWYWYGSEFEAEAYYLKLLAATDPQEPGRAAAREVPHQQSQERHLLEQHARHGARDRGARRLHQSQRRRQARPDRRSLGRRPEAQRSEDQRREPVHLRQRVRPRRRSAHSRPRTRSKLRKSGTGPLYWNGYLSNFTLEDNIRHAGLELKVDRHYYKLTPADKSIEVAGGHGQVVSQHVEKYDRNEIPDLGTVKSGDLIEIELVIESKNDYEYILFEDMKAAGCEPVALQSGYNGNELGAYMELRDNRVSLFVRNLARGQHSVSYRMRAEIPGRFSALPTKASAMYAPELRGNSRRA